MEALTAKLQAGIFKLAQSGEKTDLQVRSFGLSGPIVQVR